MFILNIQFWDGDKRHAMDLARLIADLEPEYRKDCTVLFSARFDCTHDEDTVKYVSEKFPVLKHKTRNNVSGWPAGPNAMFADSHTHCIEIIRNGQVRAEAIMFIEADCVPLHKNWLNMLIEEYRTCGKQILGAWLMPGDCGGEHINGNCIIHKDFWRKNRKILIPAGSGGWDAVYKGMMLPNAAPSKLIWSDYHLGTDRNPWRGCDYLWTGRRYQDPSNRLYGQELFPVWYHGPKNGIAIDCVRSRLLNES